MAKLWTLGGLSLPQLLRRTWNESWCDSVFGQAGRMAFYHFLAIFPSLLMLMEFARKVPFGSGMTQTAAKLVQDFLPGQSAILVAQLIGEFDRRVPLGLHWMSACAGALWAAMNGIWALIFGLNRAYEVHERRNWFELGLAITGLTVALAAISGFALVSILVSARISGQHVRTGGAWPFALHAVEWVLVGVLLMLWFAIVYRFAPNLKHHEWKWSTPGSVCALILWIVATVGLHFYFNRINDYSRTYGHLNSVVMLMLWLYFTNAAILIGGEMNSEIEKAADKQDGGADRSGS